MKATTNGHAALTPGKLERLLADLDAKAAAIRTTLAIWRGEAVAKKLPRAEAMFADAVALDAKRRTKRRTTPKGYAKGRPSSRPGTKGAAAQRKQTGATLAKIERGEALTPTDMKRVPVLSRYGYIKKSGDAHVRTAKEWRV